MRRFLWAVLGAVILPAATLAGEYALIWNGPIDNGIETRIPGFFAGSVGAANVGVHLVIGDRAQWEDCEFRIDLGEIQRRDYDGWVVLNIGGLIEEPPFYAYFVRGDDPLVHTPHEILYSGRSRRPVIEVDGGPSGPSSGSAAPSEQPGQPGQTGQPGPPGPPGQPQIDG